MPNVKCEQCPKGDTFKISGLYDEVKKMYENRYLCMICGKVTTKWSKKSL